MSPSVTWKPVSTDGKARAGWLSTPHGRVATPAFMPVGTRAVVKAVDTRDLVSMGAEIILANTYHLMLRPGADLIEGLGGLHSFMGWDGPILTDSGGFQIFSLEPHISEEGAVFRSVYDGAQVRLTPEDAMRIQQKLGPDIAMVLDVCVGLPAERAVVERETMRTLRWAERCLDAHHREDQGLFGIVQGGVDPDLRVLSASRTADLGFDGFGIGGLSVGESAQELGIALDAAISGLPDSKPRYVMGLGDTDGLLDAIGRGADMFDCVLPTRLARHGKALTSEGDLNLKNSRFKSDESPIDPACGCHVCSTHSRAYLRHLIQVKELTAHRLLSIHNLRYTRDLLAAAGLAIGESRFTEFAESVSAARLQGSP
jgi:queuine tRNA-ribosyltransferase